MPYSPVDDAYADLANPVGDECTLPGSCFNHLPGSSHVLPGDAFRFVGSVVFNGFDNL